MNQKSRKLLATAEGSNPLLVLDDADHAAAASTILLAEIVESLDSLSLTVRDLVEALKPKT